MGMRLPWPFSVRAAGYLHYVYSQQLRAVHLLDKDWLPHLLPVWMKTLQSSQKKRKKKSPPQIRGLLPLSDTYTYSHKVTASFRLGHIFLLWLFITEV